MHAAVVDPSRVVLKLITRLQPKVQLTARYRLCSSLFDPNRPNASGNYC
jgi:hypothetical protein